MRGRYPKFEVCFARTVNGMKKDTSLIGSLSPHTKNFSKKTKIENAINVHRAKSWERKLKVSAGMDGKDESW